MASTTYTTAYTNPREIPADQVRVGDQMPFFPGTEMPCHSSKIAATRDPEVYWLTVTAIDPGESETLRVRYDPPDQQEYGRDETVVIREAVHVPDADDQADSAPQGGVTVEAEKYTVSAFPHDSDDRIRDRRRHYSVFIVRRLGDRWAVTDGSDGSGAQYLDKHGRWYFSSGRDDVADILWHDWDTCVALATAEAARLARICAERDAARAERAARDAGTW